MEAPGAIACSARHVELEPGSSRFLCSIHRLFLHPYYVQAPRGHKESVEEKGRQALAPVVEEQSHGGNKCVTRGFNGEAVGWDFQRRCLTQAGVMIIQEGFLEEVAAKVLPAN